MSSVTEPVRNDPPKPTSHTIDRLARAGLLVCVAAVIGLGAYANSTRGALNARINDVDQRASSLLTHDVIELRQEASSLAASLSTAKDELAATSTALEKARSATDALRQAHGRTARTAASNTQAVKAVRDDTRAQVAEVDTKVAKVSEGLQGVASDLTATKAQVADHRRESSTATSALSDRVTRNADALSELRRKGERTLVDFDIRKSSSPEAWTVADVRIELRKTDVRRSKYDVALHADDRRLERKDLVANQPVPFLVGADRVRYELVVTSVERDRIRGYLSVPKDRALAVERSSW